MVEDFGRIYRGNVGWRDGIETNGICCMFWRERNELWDSLQEMERSE